MIQLSAQQDIALLSQWFISDVNLLNNGFIDVQWQFAIKLDNENCYPTNTLDKLMKHATLSIRLPLEHSGLDYPQSSIASNYYTITKTSILV
jgi:hypothetical protein